MGTCCAWVSAQTEATPEYQVKARYVATLAEYAIWPPKALPKSNEQPIIMGILGSAPFEPFVKDLEERGRIHGHRVDLTFLRHPSEARRCHIVFISASETYRLQEILSTLKGWPVLTIGDSRGFAQRGVMINLFLNQNRVLFEINQEALRNASIEMSSHVLKMARLVE